MHERDYALKKAKETYGTQILTTDTRAPRGPIMSPLLFILYIYI